MVHITRKCFTNMHTLINAHGSNRQKEEKYKEEKYREKKNKKALNEFIISMKS